VRQVIETRIRKLMVEAAPAIAAGSIALAAFVVIGHTPIIRALGMAITIAVMSLVLRQFGSGLAAAGGLALAFNPAFWSQTGGTETTSAALFGFMLLLSVIVMSLVIRSGRIPQMGLAAGIIVFAIVFWTLIGTPRSLRLTTLLSSGLLLALVDILMAAHPHPDKPGVGQPSLRHVTILLLLLTTGILNDPLFILLAPAVILGLTLSHVKLPGWYWAVVIIVLVIGMRGVVVQYLDTGWWLYPADQAEAAGIRVPYVMADGWRQTSRWIYLIDLLRSQFTEIGIVLGILGLSRLSRWYPPVGVITLLAFASYTLFGLVYFGKDSTILLLPMLMILVIWMTYAVYTLSHWLQKSFAANRTIKWLAAAAFMLLPVVLLIRIAGLDSA
jgi:hypothetical protein